jgi:hypothetical protein
MGISTTLEAATGELVGGVVCPEFDGARRKKEKAARQKQQKINRDERRAILRSIIASTQKNGDLL